MNNKIISMRDTTTGRSWWGFLKSVYSFVVSEWHRLKLENSNTIIAAKYYTEQLENPTTDDTFLILERLDEKLDENRTGSGIDHKEATDFYTKGGLETMFRKMLGTIRTLQPERVLDAYRDIFWILNKLNLKKGEGEMLETITLLAISLCRTQDVENLDAFISIRTSVIEAALLKRKRETFISAVNKNIPTRSRIQGDPF